jgi:hypothetical protein
VLLLDDLDAVEKTARNQNDEIAGLMRTVLRLEHKAQAALRELS